MPEELRSVLAEPSYIEHNINGDPIHLPSISLAQIATSIAAKNNTIPFGRTVIAGDDNADYSFHKELVPTAVDVVKAMNAYLGDLSDSVYLKIATVPANGEGQLDNRPGYAAGLFVKAETPPERKQAILDRLNEFFPDQDDRISLTDKGTIDLSAERLHKIVSTLEKQERNRQPAIAIR